MSTAVARQRASWVSVRTEHLELVALVAVVAVGIFLRFWDLGSQSYWHDEGTTVRVVRDSLPAVFRHVAATESTPPLYYVLAWAWEHVLGSGEAQMRSLSALAGVLTVPVAWGAVRQVASAWPALLAAAIVAVNPALVWFSQEARSYSLLVLIATAAFYFCLRARRTGARRDVVGWGVFAGLALTTHYYAAFLVLPQAILLWRGVSGERRAVRIAVAGVGLVAVALAPLAHHQGDYANWIGASAFGPRVHEFVRDLAFGDSDLISSNSPPPGSPLRWLALAALVVAAVGVLRADRRERRSLRELGFVTVVGVLLPLLVAVTLTDTFKDRNLLALWVPFFGVVGVALAVRRIRVVGAIAAAGLCAAGLHADYRVVTDPSLQRFDWRGLGHALDQPRAPRVVAMLPPWGAPTLGMYGHRLVRLPADTPVRELVFAGELGSHGTDPPAPPPGFRLVEKRQIGALWFVRYRSSRGFVFPRPLFGGASQPNLYLER